jgi:hypothetical protein
MVSTHPKSQWLLTLLRSMLAESSQYKHVQVAVPALGKPQQDAFKICHLECLSFHSNWKILFEQ